MESPAQAFTRDGYLVVRDLVPHSTRTVIVDHLVKLAAVGIFKPGDEQVLASPAKYAEPVVEELLEAMVPAVENLTGLRVFPTYSYVRLYEPGASLARHQDRAACEISLSVSLGAAPAGEWPIWIEGFQRIEAVYLAPGDALLYREIDCAHWRDAFTGTFAAQAFLHYVDRNGPHKELRFDERRGLNT